MTPTPDSTLDHILALQISVAWAGEGPCDPPRLGWWLTDLADVASGGDFFARLLPQTHRWAALESIREAARRKDEQVRRLMPDSDHVLTLFHLGFELNERLNERLAHHKRSGLPPEQALKRLFPLDQPFDRDALAAWLRPSTTQVAAESVPGGRQLRGSPHGAPELLVTHLAAALVPFARDYPAPFYRIPRP